ncbi:MAG: aminotransferase class V-fold PLP-dependent enzyme [Chloroflexota bacterium]
MTTAPPRGDADALDRHDPLAPLRERFLHRDPQRIYLDGNSLGMPSSTVRAAVEAALDAWEERLVTGWEDWIDAPRRAGDLLAAACLGARPGEVLVADSTTVNLYKLAHAALDLAEGAVVTDAANFPTDRYVLAGIAEARGRRYVEVEHAADAVVVPDAGIVCLSLVDYRSGELLDMAALGKASTARVIWDLSHAAGAVEVDLSEAELAVGCTYKYLNAGPGAPAWLYVRHGLAAAMRSPIRGWFGQREQFAMGPAYAPADGIDRFAAGTPPILGIAAVEAAAGIVGEAGISRIAAKARALTTLAIELADAWLAPLGFEVATPRDATRRGAHLALRHRDAWRIDRALIERANVIPDFREPDVVRLGFSPLTTRFVDVWDGLDRLRALVAEGTHLEIETQGHRVT